MYNLRVGKRIKGILKNKYYLFWTRFFVEINALNAVIQLFYLKRGLNPSDILYLGIAWSLSALVFEIPTGYLADTIGRKNTIIIGVILNIFGNLLMFIAYGFWPFAAITAILSLSFACFSGTEEALIYDSLRELKDEKSLLRISGKYLSAARISKIFTPFLGSIIAKNLTSTQFNILLFINFSSSFAALATSIRLSEPNRFVDISKKEFGTFTDSLNLVKKNPILLKIILNKTFVFIGSFIFWKIYQPLLLNLGFNVFFLGVLYLILQSLLSFGYWFSEQIKRKVGNLVILRFIPLVALISAIYIFFGWNKWLVFISSIIILVTGSIRDPFFVEVVQKQLKSYNRATATSVFNFFKSVFDIPLLFISGLIAANDIKNVLLISILLFVISIIFFQIKNKDIKAYDT